MQSWSKPIPIVPYGSASVPKGPGVYALLAGEDEASTVYIGAASDLLEEFRREVAQHATLVRPKARTFRYIDTPTPSEMAEQLIAHHKRRFGARPALNSGF